MNSTIAVVGMACRFPDARSPDELWENVLAQRRAFRRLPEERLNLHDYYSANRATPDATYGTEAALIEGYEFDRTRFRVAGNTFRAADMAHWLALEVASDALSDAGFDDGKGLPKDACGVLLGNSLTGEFSRANLMRLRWPYVRRVVDDGLARTGWSAEERVAFLSQLETDYKAPFPPVGDETLAGGLSNTIAGRICNHFDLQGGGYTVDGACASSLLAIANACAALVAGDLDVALAGGVDLSLDPFELVGFAKVGALAEDEMRVFDARSSGFWPGEGCGMVVLMRLEDAINQCRHIYAVVRGWGISSDGSGGLTRPEVAGQRLALQRAYRRAGYGIDAVGFFEGHGTGTPIGDATELRTLSQSRRAASPNAPSAAIGSIKANIGHTKAASGVAGFIKAALTLHKQLIPPSTGWETPHPVLAEEGHALELLREGRIWPSDVALLAGVSGMGFGGINAHVVLEGAASDRRTKFAARERGLICSPQDAELFVFSGRDRRELMRQVEQLLAYAARLSRSELVDLAARLAANPGAGPARAAVVAGTPAELQERLETLGARLATESDSRMISGEDVLLGSHSTPPRIGFLFSGQGSPANLSGGIWRRRFGAVAELYEQANLARESDGVATEIAQPAIVTASLAGLRVLNAVGVLASVAIGHSLGELVAYHWAGAMDEPTLLRLAAARGQAIAGCSVLGAMASILAASSDVERWLENRPVVISGLNSPTQTVISGEVKAVEEIVAQAQSRGIHAVRLRVSHAFHSPQVADAVPALSQALAAEVFHALNSTVVSTVTGEALEPSDDIRDLMVRQITSPVRFVDALQAGDERADLWIEVGPGRVMESIVRDSTETPVFALDAGGDSLRNLLRAVGAAFVWGAPVRPQALFDGRFRRPFELDWHPRFFVNPCELAPASESSRVAGVERREPPVSESSILEPQVGTSGGSLPVPRDATPAIPPATSDNLPALDVVRQLAAARAELPLSAVRAEHRLLNDLHLSSIAVGQLFVDAARTLGLAPPQSPTDAANATIAEVAQALEELAEHGERSDSTKELFPPGIDAWARAFTVEWVQRPLPRRAADPESGRWHVLAPEDHALANALRESSDTLSGQGVIVCLPADLKEHHIDLLLEGAQQILVEQRAAKFVLALNGGVGAAFAKSLALELPEITTCVVDTPVDDPRAAGWVLAEAQAAIGYCEARYDAHGVRREPVLRLLTVPTEEAAVPLDGDDVLLITGGGKGIAAECAFALARETGARLALLGRSRVDRDQELAANLDRMTAAGVAFKYLAVDVTDADAVRAAVSEVQSQWGHVTAVLHAAGVNKPQRLTSLNRDAVLETLRPKIDGARNVLAAIEPEHLRLLVAFGSIIGRAGLAGQADYALANEWLTHLTEAWQANHPHCHCLALEWSVWSGVGMGERLGTVDSLKRQGISPITIDDGLDALRRLISADVPATAVVVTGRFGNPPTLQLDAPDLPLLRFLERPRVFVPGVELVAEADVSLDTDPYLKDHVYQRVPLLPAVMGLEAMVQVVMALGGTDRPPVLYNVRFDQPVVVPDHAGITLRVAALRRESGQIEVVLRSSETDFQQDHFSAVCGDCDESFVCPALEFDDTVERLALDPQRDLYGEILFHTGRFQRLRGYRQLESRQCIAEISPTGQKAWFGQYLPAELVLGDAAARDAVIHAVQACIPHHTLLPIGVERLTVAAGLTAPLTVRAREVSQAGDVFTYDLDVLGDDGIVCEQWRGLRLRRVNDVAPDASWHAALWRPYIERRVGELLPASRVSVVVERNGTDPRQVRSRHAIQQTVGAPIEIRTRPDGKPEASCDEAVSVSHAADMTMAVAGPDAVACDAEPIVPRADGVWRDLLGVDRWQLAKLVAKRCHEDPSTAATRVWAAVECLKKSGSAFDAPLVFDRGTSDGWAVLTAGPLHMATWVLPRQREVSDLVVAVLVRCESARV